MSLDNARRPRSVSPQPSSGRGSPLPGTRPPRRQLEEEPRKQDKALRRYATQIERALAQVGTARLEWPDYISVLGRLLKAIQVHPPQVNTLPHRVAVSTRLAQCLNPSLPSGVHQKTLEVYAYIFELIGKDGLARDLPVFLPGLSSVLTFASLSIRPTYLDLIGQHVLQIEAGALRPALKALLLSLLPGLEDENSEDFDRTLDAVGQLRAAINSSSSSDLTRDHGFGDEYFWQCLFLASISSSSRRQGALAYMTRNLPKLGPKKDPQISATDTNNRHSDDKNRHSLPYLAESVISPEPGLLIRCFISGLEDEQPLLQRGFLDLLLSHLPLDSPVLISRVDANDLERLVAAAMNVVARRDMSLNRRLWSWFLGPNLDDSSDVDAIDPPSPLSLLESGTRMSKSSQYFQDYSFRPLKLSILKMFGETSVNLHERTRPFRICLSLMDRWEIGSLVIPHIFAPAMSSLLAHKPTAYTADFQELLRSANGFFDGIESGIIWQQLVRLINLSFDDEGLVSGQRKHHLKLVSFVIENFHVAEEEMIAFHIPLCCVFTLIRLAKWEEAVSVSRPQTVPGMVSLLLEIISQLVERMPVRQQLNTSYGNSDAASHASQSDEEDAVIANIQAFFGSHRGDASAVPPPLSSQQSANLMLKYGARLLTGGLSRNIDAESLRMRTHILSTLIVKTPSNRVYNIGQLVTQITESLGTLDAMEEDYFSKLSSISKMSISLFANAEHELSSTSSVDVVKSCCECLWDTLTPASPKHHVEAVRHMWQLNAINPTDSILESTISNSLITNTSSSRCSPAHKFAVFWNHSVSTGGTNPRKSTRWASKDLATTNNLLLQPEDVLAVMGRPLLILLAGLGRDGTDLYYFLLNWLRPVGILSVVADFLFTKLRATLNQDGEKIKSQMNGRTTKAAHEDQCSRLLYLQTLFINILKQSLESKWAVLNNGNTREHSDDEPEKSSRQRSMVESCLEIVRIYGPSKMRHNPSHINLACSALQTLQLLAANPDPSQLTALDVEDSLLDMLASKPQTISASPTLQIPLLETYRVYLKLNYLPKSPQSIGHRRQKSSLDDTNPLPGQATLDVVRAQSTVSSQVPSQVPAPPRDLIKCIQSRIASGSSYIMLERWIGLLIDVLPLYRDSIFQDLLPLVETCCHRTTASFEKFESTFATELAPDETIPEESFLSLLNGLEHILAFAHGQLISNESPVPPTKTPEQTQGFFGNVVSGVFASEGTKGRGSVANSRLTVILCLQDAVRVCLRIWSWSSRIQEHIRTKSSSSRSFNYIATKFRGRARRLLDRLFAAEPLECLETLMAHRDTAQATRPMSNETAIALLHALDGSRPKRIMPAYFNALYSRTNPSALEKGRMSSLTNDVRDVEIAAFLIDYTKSLDDDAMDEIWTDCMIFLKDVISNPMQHSSMLSLLLLFLVTLAEKVENTNFGEQKRMRKELSDLFLRLLTAIFTTSPNMSASVVVSPKNSDETASENLGKKETSAASPTSSMSLAEVLLITVPRLQPILAEPERINSAIGSISSNIFGPLIHSKSFPSNLDLDTLRLLQKAVDVSSAVKVWRKDVLEIFNHSKLFSCDRALIEEGLLPILRPWALQDKSRLADICGRIATPTSAGIMFGVGASAARLDADKKTQLNLRRIALIILALDDDAVAIHIPLLEEKLTELLGATPASSPSSYTRAELFMVLQAIVLRASSVHLAPLWPLISAELHKAINCAMPGTKDYDTYNTLSLLQACKLLDLLLLAAPDDFQTQAWLFITDTIDAVYRPSDWEPVGLVDEIAEELGQRDDAAAVIMQPAPTPAVSSRRSGLLRSRLLSDAHDVSSMNKEDVVQFVLKPFFSQLSIHNFEATYSMLSPDLESCQGALLDDLFNDNTIMG